jgi:Toprim-like/CHC2 zinc finger
VRALTLAEALRFGRGIERPFLCPEHGDTRPSASVNVIKKKWYCYTCHAHGNLSGEALLAEPDYHAMRLWLDRKMAEGTIYPESWLNRYDAGPVHPYWLRRVGEVAARRFRLGSDPESEAVTYPLRDSVGQVLGVVRRSLTDGGPKYRYPAGIDMGRLLFNYSTDQRRAVVLVEGALDAIALWNVGVDAFAIYGSRLSVDQVRLVDKVDPEFVYTAYDADDAGWQAYLDTRRAFRHRRVERLTWPRAWGGDIDEIGETHRRKVVDELVSAGLGCIE